MAKNMKIFLMKTFTCLQFSNLYSGELGVQIPDFDGHFIVDYCKNEMAADLEL